MNWIHDYINFLRAKHDALFRETQTPMNPAYN